MSYIGAHSALIPGTNVASIWIFYDYALSLDEEVEMIWKTNTTWVNAMYIFIRYLTIGIRITHLAFCSNVFGVIFLSSKGCLLWQGFQLISGQLLFVAFEILIIARVFAYYGRDKKVLAGLLFILFANFLACVVMIATSVTSNHYISNTSPYTHSGSCIAKQVSGIATRFASVWVLPLSTHCIVMILVIYRYFQTKGPGTERSPRLISVFVWDHAWAFICVFVSSIWAMLSWYIPAPNSQIALTWIYSLLGYCGTRLILNLRDVARQEADVTEMQSEMLFVGYTRPQGNLTTLCLELELVSIIGVRRKYAEPPRSPQTTSNSTF